MYSQNPSRFPVPRVIVIGAGFGGLSAALLLRASGNDVTLLEQHDWVGGKARAVPTTAGLSDAGPTVLTMRHVFDALFAATGARLEDHAKLTREPLLARHYWPDGSKLDLFDDRQASALAIRDFAGSKAAHEFEHFAQDAESLFTLFDAPMMQNPEPSFADLARHALSAPRHLPTLLTFNKLTQKLAHSFTDPRLRQLFGRYATYVGGSPLEAPAHLSLIWRAEEAGVWRVDGGMHHLAQVLADRFQAIGGQLLTGAPVHHLEADATKITGVCLKNGHRLPADFVVFAGDPRALATGLLGKDVSHIAPTTKSAPRSYSARVWSFASAAIGPELGHHNVFFASDPASEFRDLRAGRTPTAPTIYVCAQDRGSGRGRPKGQERFEIILNAPAITSKTPNPEEVQTCRQLTFQTLRRFGLTFSPSPPDNALTTPTGFEHLFPGSMGSLYGQSPHGMTAALKRPRARTALSGLYLAGGGTHPGAGVPMAALSGRHAAEAIMQDLVST